MFEKKTGHTIYTSMDGEYRRLVIKPPLSLTKYDVAAAALRVAHSEQLYKESFTEDGSATEFRIQVDSERHLNGRANQIFDRLEDAGVRVELDGSVTYA